MTDDQPADEFTIHPVSSEQTRLRVTAANGAVVVVVRHAEATAGVRLTANEARVLANVVHSTATRMEG
jgi:hypothetical protein